MITCKEDLINTYVENTPELRDAFLELAVNFGLIKSKDSIGVSTEEAVVAYWHDLRINDLRVGCWYVYADKIKEDCRKLTLSDLKPKRTRTEYEKVTESIFDLRDEFERGELYYKMSGYNKAETWRELAHFLMSGEIYRKIEKEIDERQEFIEACALAVQDDVSNVEDIEGMLFNSGKFKFIG